MRPPTLFALSRLVLAAALIAPGAAFGQAAASSPAAAPQRGLVSGIPAPATTAVVEFEGYVEIQRVGVSKRERVLAVPLELAPGDKVHTYQRGKATVAFKDASRIVLDNYAVFTVDEDESGRVTVTLLMGKLWASVSKLKRRRFDVKTPVAVASVRGTMFSVEAMTGRRAAVEVFGGSVAVIDQKGNESLLGANQRVSVLEGRMGAVERFEGRREFPRVQTPKDADKKDDKRDEKRGPRHEERGPDERGAMREQMKNEIEREVGFQVARNALEANAAYDGKNALYQEGKSLIDAFGRRVRVEQYLTRPEPNSFKVTTVNVRESRVDKSILEVVANQALPQKISDAGNLYFSLNGIPTFWATKLRWTFTNGFDRITQISVDGKPAPADILSNGVTSCAGAICTTAPGSVWQTIFGHRYEFITSGQSPSDVVMNNIWTTAARPIDDANMMWHTQPAKVVITDLMTAVPYVTWQDVFMVSNLVNNTGKTYIDRVFTPLPGLALNVVRRDYAGFLDTTGRGFLNFGNYTSVAGAPYGIANNVSVQYTRLWDGSLTPNTGGTALGGVAALNQAIFMPNNGNLVPTGNPTITTIGDFRSPALATFAAANPSNTWLVAQKFVINDLGQIRSLGSPGNISQVNEAFESYNFERSVVSSKFPGRSIDVVFDPHFYLQSGLISPKLDQQGIGN